MPDIDLFNLWRHLLSIVVTIYVAIYTLRTIWSWLLFFRLSPRHTVMGHYAMVLLLRARVRRFSHELLQIAGLLAVMAGLVGLHWVLL
jgi:hypothetical protein